MEHNTPHPDGPRPEAGHQLFSWIRSTGVVRPDSGWAGGVMAALAARLGWDAALVRGLGVVALILFISPTALLYGLAWILLPNPRGEIHLQEAMRGNWSAGVFGGGLLAVIGGVNVFTPVSLAGPFAVLVNLAVLGAVLWAVWALVRKHRQNKAEGAYGASPSGPGAADRAGSGGQDETPGKARAGSSSSARDEQPGVRRADGRPAWYPKDTADDGGAPAGSSPSGSSPSGTGAQQSGPAGVSSGGPAPAGTGPAPAGSAVTRGPARAEREAGRRRSLLTLGLVLLGVPVLLGAMWLAAQFGATLFTGLLVGLAGAVVILAITHIIAAARGRQGSGGLLTVAAALMLVVFAGQSASSPSGASHAFGNYHTQEDTVHSAFSNTTVDLRHMTRQGADEESTHAAEINSAFSNTTVVVPDDTRVLINNGHALGNLDVYMQEDSFTQSGISGSDAVAGPEDASNEITLDLNSAFGNIDIYDTTTYAAEVEGIEQQEPDPDEAEGAGSGTGQDAPRGQEEAR